MENFGLSFLAPLGRSQEIDQSAQKQPLELQHIQALTRMQNAQAAESENRIEMQKRSAALMMHLGAINPDGTQATGSPSSFQRQLAAALASEGKLSEASRAEAAANLEDYRLALEKAAQQRVQHLTDQDKTKRFEWVVQHMPDVKDQKSWEDVNSLFSQTFPEDQNPLANMPYNPKFVDALRSMSMTQAQKIQANQRERDLQSKLANRGDLAQTRAVTREVARARERRMEDRSSADKKIAGKDVGAPSGAEIKQAETLLNSDKSLNLEDDERKLAASDIAAQARAKRKGNPGMTQDEAMRQTLAEQKKRGDYVTQTKPAGFLGSLFGETKKETSYQHKAQGQTQPQGEKVIPQSNLQKGKVYSDAQGNKKRWTGTGWEEP